MKIKFVIGEDYDFEMAVQMLRGKDWEYRAQRMELDPNMAKLLNKSKGEKFEKAKEEFRKFVAKEYTQLLPFIRSIRGDYQKSWDGIINEFSKSVEEITYPWIYDEYLCVVTNFNSGISNWNGNVVARWWKENPYLQRRITAHEILLAHYFSIHRKYFPASGLTDKQIWALAEIAAWSLTGLEEKIKKFWPWDHSGYYTNHNYQHLVKLQEALKEPFLRRKNFEEYVLEGIELVKNLNPEASSLFKNKI